MAETISWKFDSCSLEDGDYFHGEEHDANLLEWACKHFWTSDEAAALTFAKSPSHINQDYVYSVLVTESEFINRFTQLIAQIEQAQRNRTLPHLIRPSLYVEWAAKSNVELPPDLIAAIRDADAPLDNLRAEVQSLTRKLSKSTQEVERLNRLLVMSAVGQGADSSPSKNPSAEKKNENSQLKIILAMACEKYRFDRQSAKQSAATNIASDCVMWNLPVDVDTVRKWLAKANQEYGGEIKAP